MKFISELFQPDELDKLVFEVRDTGIGIKKIDQGKLFKMFATLSSTKQMNTNGVGLGLFICKQLLEQFQGKITVKSKVNKGTSFFFTFKIESATTTFKPDH
jgi:two-component system aerobic respiration control sensor histidine kinase ArcB